MSYFTGTCAPFLEADAKALVARLPKRFGDMTVEDLQAVGDAYSEISRQYDAGLKDFKALTEIIFARGTGDQTLNDLAAPREIPLALIESKMKQLEGARDVLSAWERRAGVPALAEASG